MRICDLVQGRKLSRDSSVEPSKKICLEHRDSRFYTHLASYGPLTLNFIKAVLAAWDPFQVYGTS
jgi:hypothetical protein